MSKERTEEFICPYCGGKRFYFGVHAKVPKPLGGFDEVSFWSIIDFENKWVEYYNKERIGERPPIPDVGEGICIKCLKKHPDTSKIVSVHEDWGLEDILKRLK